MFLELVLSLRDLYIDFVHRIGLPAPSNASGSCSLGSGGSGRPLLSRSSRSGLAPAGPSKGALTSWSCFIEFVGSQKNLCGWIFFYLYPPSPPKKKSLAPFRLPLGIQNPWPRRGKEGELPQVSACYKSTCNKLAITKFDACCCSKLWTCSICILLFCFWQPPLQLYHRDRTEYTSKAAQRGRDHPLSSHLGHRTAQWSMQH